MPKNVCQIHKCQTKKFKSPPWLVLHASIFVNILKPLDFSLRIVWSRVTDASGYLCTFTLPLLAGICGVGYQMKMFAGIIGVWDCVQQASVFILKADAFSWKAVSQHGGHYHCRAPFEWMAVCVYVCVASVCSVVYVRLHVCRGLY